MSIENMTENGSSIDEFFLRFASTCTLETSELFFVTILAVQLPTLDEKSDEKQFLLL